MKAQGEGTVRNLNLEMCISTHKTVRVETTADREGNAKADAFLKVESVQSKLEKKDP